MANKLLLIEDVEDLGRSGDIVTVKPGYARNYLLPRGYAILASKNAIRLQARLQEERKKRAIIDKEEADRTAASLGELTLSTVVKVDQEGHMYGSVSTHDLVELLKEQANIELEKRSFGLKHPIKETGVHEIPIKLKEGVMAKLVLKVIPEGGVLPAESESKEEEKSE
jgi:large subunit ribosomal protein L9